MSNRLGFTVKKSAALINQLKPYAKLDAPSLAPSSSPQADAAKTRERAGVGRKPSIAGTQQTAVNSITNYFQRESSNALCLQGPLTLDTELSSEALELPESSPGICRRSRSSSSLFSELTSLYGTASFSFSDTLDTNENLRRPLRKRPTKTPNQLFRSLIRSYDMCSLENLLWMELDNKYRDTGADRLEDEAVDGIVMDLDELGTTSKKRARADFDLDNNFSDSEESVSSSELQWCSAPKKLKSSFYPLEGSTNNRLVKPSPIPLRMMAFSSTTPTLPPLVLRTPPIDRSQALLDIQALYSAVEEEFDDLRRQVRNKLSMKEVEVLLREGLIGEFGGTSVGGTYGVQVC